MLDDLTGCCNMREHAGLIVMGIHPHRASKQQAHEESIQGIALPVRFTTSGSNVFKGRSSKSPRPFFYSASCNIQVIVVRLAQELGHSFTEVQCVIDVSAQAGNMKSAGKQA
eukprot:6453966-Amphidinium_carterae.1